IEDAERLIRDTYNSGINVNFNIVIGFPNETERDFHQTMEFIKRNKSFISFVSSPGECWIGNQTYLNTHPEEFGVEPMPQGHLWQTKDGKNTHRVREERMAIFNDFVNSLGLPLHNYTALSNRNPGSPVN
ncbi:MAG: hypothetical protein Q7U96_05100, partial [Chloroflexota bacterium]|nr:hypothetical protein [Chloroflexota bacterium]